MGERTQHGESSRRLDPDSPDPDDWLARSRLLLEVVWLALRVTLLIGLLIAMAFGVLGPEQVL